MQISEKEIEDIIRLYVSSTPIDFDDYRHGAKLAAGHIMRKIKERQGSDD